MYSTARLHIYERRKIRKISGGGGNWTQIVPHGNTEGYSKLAIKNQQSAPLPGVEPGTSCTEICHSSL